MNTLDEIVNKELDTSVFDRSCKSHTRNLFASYHTILCGHGIGWILEENQNIALNHVLLAIRPKSLCQLLYSDPAFAYHDLRKDFTGFMDHSINISEAAQRVHNWKPINSKDGNMDRNGKTNTAQKTEPKKTKSNENNKKQMTQEASICLNPACNKNESVIICVTTMTSRTRKRNRSSKPMRKRRRKPDHQSRPVRKHIKLDPGVVINIERRLPFVSPAKYK